MVCLAYGRRVEVHEVYETAWISRFLAYNMHTCAPGSRSVLKDSLDNSEIDVSIKILLNTLKPVYWNCGRAMYSMWCNIFL